MAYIRNSDRENIGRNFRGEAVIALQCLNRLVNDSSTEGSQLNDVINELEFLKSSIDFSLGGVSATHGRQTTTRERDEGHIIIASIDNAIDRGKTVLNSLPYHSEEKKFNGNPVDWLRFLETFEKSVHSKSNYSDACKLRCLMNMVEGLPKEQIKKLPLIDESYLKALELLKSTFQNKKALIEAHLYALFDLKSPVAMPESLSEFRNDYEYHIKALKTYEAKFETSAGFIIAEILKRKLPKEIQDRVNEVNVGNYWCLSKFVKALNYEIDILTGKHGSSSSLFQDDTKSGSSNTHKKNTPKLLTKEENNIPSLMSKIIYPLSSDEQNNIPRPLNQNNLPPFLLNRHNIMATSSNTQSFIAPSFQETSTEDLRMYLSLKGINKEIRKKKTKRQIKYLKRKGIKTNKIDRINREMGKKKKERLIKIFKRQEIKAKKKLNAEKHKQKQESLPSKKGIKVFRCPYCQNGHLKNMCPVYDTPVKRRERAKELQRCLRCLSKAHSTRKCKVKVFCKFCKGIHRPSLCLRKTKAKREEKMLQEEVELWGELL